ncbi:MAG: ABC transporter permease [Bacteroidota bacterium]
MLRFVFRRLIVLLPTLLVLSWLAFGLSRCTPDDPVARILPQEELRLSQDDPLAYERIYRQAAENMGRHLPLFYFSISHGASLPDELEAPLPQQQEWLEHHCRKTGRPEVVAQYYSSLRALALSAEPDISTPAKEILLTIDQERAEAQWSKLISSVEASSSVRFQDEDFRRSESYAKVDTSSMLVDSIGVQSGTTSKVPTRESLNKKNSLVEEQSTVQELLVLKTEMEENPTRGRLLLPSFSWHGLDNQYHRWLGGILRGDFGTSYANGQPVGQRIGQALKWTALINFLALLLAYGVAVPLGLRLGARAGSKFDSRVSFFLLLLFSIPAFWLATMISSFFTTPAYGMDWFPSMGFGRIPEGSSWLTVLWIRVQHLFLPVLMLAYPSWAYLSRQMRRSTVGELGKPYIMTARLKGLNDNQILRKHVLRNALFPIITLLAGLLPTLLAGSVLIELIFNLPGMGRLLVQSTLEQDWPVVTAILIISGLATIMGLLLADILYRWADPRLRNNSPSNAAV